MSSGNSSLGIIVGIDDSPAAQVAVRWAARDAELRKIPLTLVHAVSPEVATWLEVPLPPGVLRWQQDHGRHLIDDALKVVEQASLRAGPPTVHSEIVPAAAVPTLVDMSKDAVLMVVGCLGSGRWPGRLLGSVSSGLLRHAHCPVVIIHDEDSVMPHPQQAPVLVGVDGSSAFGACRSPLNLSQRLACHDDRARMERRRCVGVARNRLAGNSVDGRAGAGRAVGGLAGAVSQRSHNPRGGARSAGPPARPTLRGSPAGRGRQPGPRRLRRNAGGRHQVHVSPRRFVECDCGRQLGSVGETVAQLARTPPNSDNQPDTVLVISSPGTRAVRPSCERSVT